MAQHNQLGKTGEERATEYLISKGYIIRDINWRSGKMELDIVAYRDKTLVVVEVKTRKKQRISTPGRSRYAPQDKKYNPSYGCLYSYVRYTFRHTIRHHYLSRGK